MVITGAFFAENAATVDNKLHVWGGVFENVWVGPDRLARLTLVVLLQHGREADGHSVQVEFIPPGDDPKRAKVEFDLPEGAREGEIAHAYYRIGIPLSVDGRYVCLVSAGGATISLPLNVISPPN